MNSTAYRIYKLLQWLMISPLSVPALNAKFCEDPLIGKPLSPDSIWLYINTLKALGCRIRRPSLKNQFCYELLAHPFGIQLTEANFELLAQVKAYTQAKFTHQEILILDRFFKKIVSQGSEKFAQEAIDQLFAQSRSYDYADSEKHLQQLERAISKTELLKITYSSPVRGKETFVFLPECLFYEQGVVYIRGERSEQEDPSNLRLERILVIEPCHDAEMCQKMLVQRLKTQPVHLRIQLASSKPFEGFGLSSNQGVYSEKVQYDVQNTTYDIHLEIRENFYLKQRILACGHPVQILEPLSLKEDLHKTLKAMWHLYESEEAAT